MHGDTVSQTTVTEGIDGDRDDLRAVIVHDRSTLLGYSSDDLNGCPAIVATASYGVEALRVLLREPAHVLVADAEGHFAEAIEFVNNARRIWPWLTVVLIESSSGDRGGSEADVDVDLRVRKPVAAVALTELISRAGVIARTRIGEFGPNADPVRLARLVADLGPTMQAAIGASTLLGGLRELGTRLLSLLDADIIGLLGYDDEPILNLLARRPLRLSLLGSVEEGLLTSFRALSGVVLDRAALRVEREHVECDPGGAATLSRHMSVPVICGDQIVGLLFFGDAECNRPYSIAEVREVCLVATHIGSIFAALRSMRSLASRDPLTSTLNRLGLEDALERTWQMSRRYGFPMGVVVADLDHFKTLNDSYGHSLGDAVIREFAAVMHEASRSSDIIARYGGDEFVAILPQADEAAARIFSERLLQATRERVFSRQSHRLSITVSVGLSTTQSPMPPATGSELLNQADRALYTAKREGRNRLCIWPESMETLPSRPVDEVSADDADGAGEEAVFHGRIMVVDDEPMVRKTIQVILQQYGYEVEAFDSAEAAIDVMQGPRGPSYDLVLTDLNMPGKSGIELLQEIASVQDSVVKIVITGYATVDNAVSSLREGAYDFIQKPVRATQLHATIRRALEYRRLKIENARYHAHLEELVRERSAQLAASLEEIKRSHEFTLEALVAMLDARENQTGRHSVRVRDLSVALGERIGFGDDDLRMLAQGALLHDIGKISVSDAILLKPGPLLPEEWEVMRRHPETGYRILQNSSYLKDAAALVWEHHESYDGSGYPRGLKGEQISMGARVFKIIDVYEAMRSDRVYRASMPVEEVALFIREHSGRDFDPSVVDSFLQSLPELERILAMM